MPLSGNRILVVGQSGGPTPVINASLAGILLEAYRQNEFDRIFGLVHGVEGALKEEFIDISAESSETISRLINTPASILGSCRRKLSEVDYERILTVFRAHDIHDFIYIGGNDSMDTCQRISHLADQVGYELQVVGVPKTIDNDLALTDHSPGYGSAARFVALTARDAGRDLESMSTFDDVTILETMGRNAGWLTAASILAKTTEEEAPHLVYVPEIPFSEQHFLEDVLHVHRCLGRVFVVVCEGLRDPQGRFVGDAMVGNDQRDTFGHTLVALSTGVAAYLSSLVKAELKLRSRFLRPGLMGRVFSACVSDTDRQEATDVGRAAVAHLVKGIGGCMVALVRSSITPYRCELGLVPLSEVANKEKLLPPEFLKPDRSVIADNFREYALPLIGAPLQPLARLRGQKIPLKLQ